MTITLPLAREPEMTEVQVAIFDPEMKGTTFREPLTNVFDHMTRKGFWTQINGIE